MHVNEMGLNVGVRENFPQVYRDDGSRHCHENELLQKCVHVFHPHEKKESHGGGAESSREQPPSKN